MHGDQVGARSRARVGYLPGLDGLRAISVVAVLLYHARMPWLAGGFLGVEVFFVISGYLITLLLTEEFQRTATISCRHFWLRRARRLLAALYTLLAVVSIVVLMFYREEAGDLAGQAWAALGYCTNWYLIFSEQSYFAVIERPPVFQHLWSLAIEEQFYLLWPVLLIVLLRVFRGRRHAIAAVIIIGAVASIVWMAILFDPVADPSRAYYGTDTRASGLLLGAALALLWRPTRASRGVNGVRLLPLDLIGIGAVAVIIVCFVRIDEFDSLLYRGGFAVVDVAAAVAIMAAVHRGTALGRIVLAHPLLTWVGVRSYALYLWHWPIFVFTRPEIDLPIGLYPALVLRLVLTVIAADLSYRYVEVPIRNGAFTRWRQRLARRRGARRRAGPIVLAAAAGLLLLAVTTVDARAPSDEPLAAGPANGDATPSPSVPNTTTPAIVDQVAALNPLAGSTTTMIETTTTTTIASADLVTVLADSVLLGAKREIDEELGDDGYHVVFRARPALMLHYANDELVAAGKRVGDTVIVGLGYNTLWERDRANFDYWAAKFDREADELLDTLARLGAKRIIWVTLREPSEAVIPALGAEQIRRFVWYFPYVNERLRALVAGHPGVTLADWTAVSNVEGLTYDAMHLTSDGIRLMVDTIRQAGGL